MKVSIITISYNSEATIESTILSVINQTYSNIEYIVVDGKSSDRTIEIVGKHKAKISTFISEPDKGIYDAMNKGVALATGDIIGILNSDDFYADENVISDIAGLFQKAHCEAVYADLVYVDREDDSKILRTWNAGQYKSGMFLKGWMPPHPTFFVKASIYAQYGLYNTMFRSSADYEFMLRVIHKHHVKVNYLDRVITKMRSGGQSNVSIKNRIKANMEDRKAWRINGLKPGSFSLTRKPLSKVFQFLNRG